MRTQAQKRNLLGLESDASTYFSMVHISIKQELFYSSIQWYDINDTANSQYISQLSLGVAAGPKQPPRHNKDLGLEL